MRADTKKTQTNKRMCIYVQSDRANGYRLLMRRSRYMRAHEDTQARVHSCMHAYTDRREHTYTRGCVYAYKPTCATLQHLKAVGPGPCKHH